MNRKAWIRNEFIPYDVLKDRWKMLVMKRLKPTMKRMILAGMIGAEYTKLGTSKAFHSFLQLRKGFVGHVGFTLSENVVRACG